MLHSTSGRGRIGILIACTSFISFGYFGNTKYVDIFGNGRKSQTSNSYITSLLEYSGVPNGSTYRHGYVKNTIMKTHIAFLKVHKAGSSTLQNIFFRFGLKHMLNVLVPKTGNFLHGRYQIMPLKQNEHYDIFACHTYYRKDKFESLLPADAVKIGIVRHPLDRMISSAFFYREVSRFKYLKNVPSKRFVNNLVNFPEKYDPKYFSFTRNSMARDFGFPMFKPSDIKNIREYLDKLNLEFLLILILEQFNESLVLMKRFLNWGLIDILYLAKNAHQHEAVFFNETEVEKIKITNFLDYEIYEYFLKVFEMKLKNTSKDFYDEVTVFKTVLEKVGEFCNTKNDKLVVESSKWNDEFTVFMRDCALMNRTELSFIAFIRRKLTEN
ncbi:galactose-3-O-sulfotransferase 2-like [Mercenaria mercenaria]|uniref:galactose-3-O-sulfotransferase 2-like n=1 Tax=Mercenaria mercenaria TaxID=6596 RepID=UPI00234F6A19|nr:galactose-3-O-sulfotransferase 2-like [Mercenaria mercenaria]